ncbi:isochorismate synthase [Xylanimonas protaetiae]|uniref:isochorismate synthase n=1 Tax=Xylanimonas protaetiae TaxID=2509457 RepID=A0A4P6F7A5_9MICO|nr:isochorismate synthase [Xylanimonas protaetiae]
MTASLGAGERAVVALPFEHGGTAVAHRVRPEADSADVADVPPPAPSAHAATPEPSEAAYAARVTAALGLIAAGDLRKVVLGRWVDVVSDPPLDPRAVVARLLDRRPGRYVFGVPLTADAAGPVLLGASPELLVRRTGDVVTCFPLAGSVPRSADEREDARRAAGLGRSAKDLAEHAFVVDAITAALAPVCVEVDVPARPVVVSTDTLHHLGTPVRARLAPGTTGWSALHLALLLHPTPAVGGVPTTAALDAIAALEPGPRGPLAGAVGWVDAAGDGEFAVTIRAGVLDGPTLRLFAGAGIVAGSDPAAEVRETGAKLATMMTAVGP